MNNVHVHVHVSNRGSYMCTYMYMYIDHVRNVCAQESAWITRKKIDKHSFTFFLSVDWVSIDHVLLIDFSLMCCLIKRTKTNLCMFSSLRPGSLWLYGKHTAVPAQLYLSGALSHDLIAQGTHLSTFGELWPISGHTCWCSWRRWVSLVVTNGYAVRCGLWVYTCTVFWRGCMM